MAKEINEQPLKFYIEHIDLECFFAKILLPVPSGGEDMASGTPP